MKKSLLGMSVMVFIVVLISFFLVTYAPPNEDKLPSVEEKKYDPTNFPVDLSPLSWGEGELEKYTHLMQGFKWDNPIVEGKDCIVAGISYAPAQRAGLEALKQGGNAMDAALTTSLTQIALVAGSVTSYAGVMTMVYYDTDTKKYYNLNAWWNTLLEEDDPLSIPRNNPSNPGNFSEPIPSGRTALVPGYMAGVEAGHKRFGKLPFSALFSPAVFFAEQGFRLNQNLGLYLISKNKVLSRLPTTKAIFTKKDGSFYKTGDIFTQPELAKTLRKVAEQGTSYMYTGEWAKKLVEAIGRDGGKMTMEDLKKYKPIWSDPLEISYGDYIVYAQAEPSWGGVNLAEALNVSQEADLVGMGHYSESPEAFFWWAQINRLFALGHIDEMYRSKMLGGADASNKTRTTKAHAQRLWTRISNGEFAITKVPDIERPEHSDAIVVIDRWGNMAALVHSINTGPWGDTGIFVDGISIPDSAKFQQRAILQTGQGNRLPDPTNPVIISKNNEPFIALSSIGSGLYQVTLSTLINIMGYNMGLKEAIDAPSFDRPKSDRTGILGPRIFPGDFSDELISSVKELGLDIEIRSHSGDRGMIIGAMIASDGKRNAVTYPFINGVALGY